ncbi:FAD-dependent thymidylate synthase [Streptomyces sp. NBC_00197]|jgi:thymidylate synthase (FAD)|uniref:FAD-dependent thymidylate synthase n=1 Tax=Streptomyces sp. NBC_00197 TaxID=2975676 RepID=UPI00324A83F4
MGVDLIDHMGNDDSIVRAARVSSGTTGSEAANKGLINMLARDRHGSPFEAVTLQFKIDVPIFVAREWFRHRMSSFNEVSGRYTVLEPVFYVPSITRPLRQFGKPGAYSFEAGDYQQQLIARSAAIRVGNSSWEEYTYQLDQGIAREVARNVLPLSLYTSFYWTVNLRSALNFLSLRWAHPDSTVPTFPLYEIERAAMQVEAAITNLVAPEAMKAFNVNGRVAP